MFLRQMMRALTMLDSLQGCVQIERFDGKELELASRTLASIVNVHAEGANRYDIADADHS